MSGDESTKTYGDSARDPDVASTGTGANDERRLVSRRALIRAGWTLPAILGVTVPTNAFAQYAHGDTHGDMTPRGVQALR